MEDQVLTVSDFIAVFNQTLEYAYPTVVIEGELANFKISKNKWIYFDLKDKTSCLKFFGTVYMLHTPLENGMLLKVNCFPRMHNMYGLSMQVQTIEPTGEGSIKRSALLLEKKLRQEGLFNPEKKRTIPYPPKRIGLITSAQSAAYTDFIKIINSRWQGIEIDLIDVQVQGELAVVEVSRALDHFNKLADDYETIVIIRGGGSPEDLAAFSSETVTRAVAGSKIPTLVAVGHEIDISLAELAADLRASTPSNAAELLVPDKKTYFAQLRDLKQDLSRLVYNSMSVYSEFLERERGQLKKQALNQIEQHVLQIESYKKLLIAYNPMSILKRGYAVVRQSSQVITSASQLKINDKIKIQLAKGQIGSIVRDVIGDKYGRI